MAGTIDEHGQQWEHCNKCSRYVKLQDLCYETKSAQHPYGRSLCITCAGAPAGTEVPPLSKTLFWVGLAGPDGKFIGQDYQKPKQTLRIVGND